MFKFLGLFFQYLFVLCVGNNLSQHCLQKTWHEIEIYRNTELILIL